MTEISRDRIGWAALGAVGVLWFVLVAAWKLDEHFVTRRDFDHLQNTVEQTNRELREVHAELTVLRQHQGLAPPPSTSYRRRR